MEEKTLTVTRILDALNAAWARNQELFDDDDITIEEKAGRDAAVIYLAKELGLVGAFIVSPQAEKGEGA
jgi:hypothetical protein